MDGKANQRVYRDIAQRYCSHMNDNVIVVRDLNKQPDEYECLSAHLCKSKPDCKRRYEHNDAIM